jgi:hypothetical protein
MRCTVNDTAGYPKKNIATTGGNNRWIVHRAWFFVLQGPTLRDKVDQERLDCAHRCGKGRYTQEHPYACINPYHITACTHAVNLSHDKDLNSCAEWCTHDPKCIYTNSAGTWLPCRNSRPLIHPCQCGNNCFNRPRPEPGSESEIETEELEVMSELMSSLGLEEDSMLQSPEMVAISSEY